MALPGTPGQRISDLCNSNHISQKQLAEKIGVSASQLSRIVSGETKTVSSDILIGVAKEFKVSTDYILGLSTLSVRKSYDISELGLSEGAVRGLVTGAVDVQILNRLLEHRNFPKLMDLIRIYFQDTAAKGIMARNQLIELATASLSDLMKEHPEHRAEERQDLQLLNAQKMGEHEAEIEKIKNVFLAILRDIKKDMDSGEQPGEAVTAAMFQIMQETMKDHQQEPLSMDDVAAMIAGQIGWLLPMDEETAEQFQQLAKKMMEQSGKQLFDERHTLMRVIIHDLDADYEKSLKTKCTQLIYASGKYAGCQGCFGCWTKHPAECFIHDNLQDICRIIGRADELIIITENCYGTYSPFVKAIIDRSIGLSTPLSIYRGGQMHHTLRYGEHKIIKVYVYGDILEQERITFEQITIRNALNYGYRKSQVVFVKHPEQLAGVIE